MGIKGIWRTMGEAHVIVIFLILMLLLAELMKLVPGTRLEDAIGTAAFVLLVFFVISAVVRRWVLFREEDWDQTLKIGLLFSIKAALVAFVIVLLAWVLPGI